MTTLCRVHVCVCFVWESVNVSDSYFHCWPCGSVLMTQGTTLWQQMGASQHSPFNILLSAITIKLMHKTVTSESHWCLFAWDHKTRSIKFPLNHVMWYEDSPLLVSLCSKVIWGTLSKFCLEEHSKCDMSFLAMFHSEHTSCGIHD